MVGLYLLIIFNMIVVVFIGIWGISAIIGIIRAQGVPYVPLSKKQLRLLKDNVEFEPEAKTVDLGCGDGRVLFLFEELGVKDLSGYEVNFWAYLKAKIVGLFKKSKVKLYYKNFKYVDLSGFDVVFCYLLDEYLAKIEYKLKKELKPGTKIVSFAFKFPNWPVDQEIITNKDNSKLNRIYIYRV